MLLSGLGSFGVWDHARLTQVQRGHRPMQGVQHQNPREPHKSHARLGFQQLQNNSQDSACNSEVPGYVTASVSWQ